MTTPNAEQPCNAGYPGSMPELAGAHCCLDPDHVGDHVAPTGYRWPNETPRTSGP